MNIKSLSEGTLKPAGDLLINTFELDESDFDYPPRWLKASIGTDKKIFDEYGVNYTEYWVALDDSGLVGVVGLYAVNEGKDDTYWLGWFAVSRKARRKGVGSKLLDFAIQKAREDGKKYLRLYTSDSKIEEKAQLLYDKYGFKTVSEGSLEKAGYKSVRDDRFKREGEKRIFKQLDLF